MLKRTKLFSLLLAIVILHMFINYSQAEDNITSAIRILPVNVSFDKRAGTTTYSCSLVNVSRNIRRAGLALPRVHAARIRLSPVLQTGSPRARTASGSRRIWAAAG